MPEKSVREKLEYALWNNLLPETIKESAIQTLEGFEKPLRIVLLGLPKAGKTAVLNLLLGKTLVPEGLKDMPTVRLEHGLDPRMFCTLPNGSKKTIDGIDFTACSDVRPAFVSVQVDLPALAKITVMEIAAPNVVAQQKKAVSWACQRADVVIWCTTDFTPVEQEIWDVVPDHLKDHGFLLLTKTDNLMGQAEVNTRLAALSRCCGDEFLRILPLSGKLALESRGNGSGINMNLFKSSGATGLISAIKGQIQEFDRALEGSAEQILARYCRDEDFQEQPVETPPAPKVDAPAQTSPPHVAEIPQTAAPVSQDTAERPRKAAPKLEVVDDSYTEKPVQEPVKQVPDTVTEDRVALEKALAILAVYERNLVAVAANSPKWEGNQALEICEEAVTMLPEVLEEGTSSIVSDIVAGVYDVQDMLMLMQHEKTEAGADEGLTLLLQIRRDIEGVLACAA